MVRVRIASLAVMVSLALTVLSAHAQSYHSAQYPPTLANPLGGRVQTSACALDRNPVNATAGNAYLVGFNTLSLAETPQFPLLVGFDPSGFRTWYENPDLGLGSATAVVVDSQGYILVATTAGMVYRVAPPQPQQPQLQPVVVGSFNLGGIANRMVLDTTDNLYITGYTGNRTAIFTHRLNRTTGGYVPATGWPQSVAGSNAAGNAVAVRNGSVYVAGTADRGLGTFGDGVALRFAGSGGAPQAQYWYDGTNGASSGNDVFNDLAVDASGNVYVTGTTDAMIDLPATDYVTVRLNAGSLALGWARTFSGSELIKPRKTSIDSSLFLALDPFEQNVYVTGNAMNLGVGGIQTLKYSATGTLVGSSRTDNASVSGLFVSSAGQVFVGGVAGTSVLLLAHPNSLTGTILGTPAYVDMTTLPNGLAGAAPTISCLLGRNTSGNPALFTGGFYKITYPSGPPLQAIGVQWVNP